MSQAVIAPDTTLEADERASGQVKEQPASRWTSIKKWGLRCLLVGVCLFAAGAVFAKVQFDRIEKSATKLSETGISLNKFLKEFSTSLKAKDIDALLSMHATEYASTSDSAWSMELSSDQDGVLVYDWKPAATEKGSGFSLRDQLTRLLADCEQIEMAKFKISSIESMRADGEVEIKAVLWIRGSGLGHPHLESRAAFDIRFTNTNAEEWKIADKALTYGQTVVGQGKGFENITDASGIEFVATHNPKYQDAEWKPSAFEIMQYSSGGASAGDFDGDGIDDLLLADGGSTRLYKCMGDGQFVDVTSEAGLPTDILGATVGLFADFDNDGDKDLLLGRGTGDNFLFRNNGDGKFEDVTDGSGVQGLWVSTGCVADYDNDGLLDIYLGRYLDPRTNIPTTSFYTRNGEGNTLLHNDGGLRFSDRTETAGVREGGLTLGTAWGDYDNDGLIDLYIANDFGRNSLFRNKGDGTFDDVTEESGTINIGYGMSAQWGDIDNDLDLDLIVGALHSGQRWYGNSLTIQRYLISSLQEGTIREDWSTYLELYHHLGGSWQNLGHETLKGNTLLLNNGDGTFKDVTAQSHVNPHGWYWSTLMFDVDNDCRQDLYMCNGWITAKLEDDL